MALTASSDLEDSINTSVFEQSSPESLRPRTLSPPTHDRSSSTSSRPTLHNEIDDDYFGPSVIKQCTSSRSSISSFPSSVIHTIQFTDNEDYGVRTPSRSQLHSNGRSSPAYKPSTNSYLSAFRHPNSVRALQLESEYNDSDGSSITGPSRHRKSPKPLYFSPRSPGSLHSSPTKRSSRPGTPQQQRSSSKLKKEFPLVLLHCTLLPPATTTRGLSVPEDILEAVLPEDYRKRWRTLQDKVMKNNELKQRGVLIAHPRDDYDLLEERVLEALELERPRIRKGHYLGTNKSDSDSGFESSSQNDTDDGSDADERDGASTKDKCPDCGKAVSCKVEQDRKWEVKIFAANGLMRSGAWSAAWEQMEKIDVEVAVWMPEDVRFEVEERLKALKAKEEAEKPVEEPVTSPRKKRTRSNTARVRHDERMREIYGEPEKNRTQEDIDGLADPKQPEPPSVPVDIPNAQEDLNMNAKHVPSMTSAIPDQVHRQEIPPQADFLTFMKYHFRMIMNDQRNLAIVLLSILVLFFSVQNLDLSSTSTPKSDTAVQTQTTSTAVAMNTPPVSMETVSITPTISESGPSASPQSPSAEELPNTGSTLHVEEYVSLSESSSDEDSTISLPPEPIAEASEVETNPELETELSQIHTPVVEQNPLLDPDHSTVEAKPQAETESPLPMKVFGNEHLNEDQSEVLSTLQTPNKASQLLLTPGTCALNDEY